MADRDVAQRGSRNMHKIRVSLAGRSYDVIVTTSGIKALAPFLKRLDLDIDCVAVTNPTIASLYGASIKAAFKKSGHSAYLELIPDTEKAKSFKAVSSLIERIALHDKSKGIFIVAFGGGVVGDVAGFAASIYKRGVPYIQVPTTLLAQVDSSIGGKTGIDLKLAKNLVGSIYQPKFVFASVEFIKTLSDREYRSGLSEVVKYGAIHDRGFFNFLKRNRSAILKRQKNVLGYIIYKCASIKARYVSSDEREAKGLRTELNFGHTIGHALEAACGYSKALSHGEAISIGMVVAANISYRLGLLKKSEVGELESLLSYFGLPIRTRVKAEPIIRAYMHDKKFTRGMNRFILLKRIGEAVIREGIPESIIRGALR